MNNFLCSLLCTCMTIIDCLFYASGSLSYDVHGSILLNASCVVVNDDIMRAMKM